jgi:hypothetical protein
MMAALLYTLACLKHNRQTEIRFNVTEAAVRPLLRVYRPWGASARVSSTMSLDLLAITGPWAGIVAIRLCLGDTPQL